jgi:hypothetical protein
MPNSRPFAQKTGSSNFDDKFWRRDVQNLRRRRSSRLERPSPVIITIRHRGSNSNFIAKEVQEEDEPNTPEEELTNKILRQPLHRSSPWMPPPFIDLTTNDEEDGGAGPN